MNLSIRNTVILSIFSIFLGNSKAFTQLTLDEAINIGFGTSYLKLKQHLSSKFSYNRTLMKGDFLNTYLIKYEEVPFDYYGNANYHFRIVENKLVNVEIEFEFNPSEIWKVKRVSELLEHDLIKRFNLLNEDSLNADEAVKELTKNCRYNFKKEEFDSLMPINYGTNYYDVYRKNPTDTLIAKLGINSYLIKHGIEKKYTNVECKASVALSLTNFKMIGLYSKAENAGIAYQVIDEKKEIKLISKKNVYELPVTINGTITLNFILDLGASDVSISPDLFLVLIRSGSITNDDYIGSQTYKFADGTIAKSTVFNLKKVQIGEIEIQNVKASVSNSVNAPLLLGQSALKKLGNYKIDNNRKMLILE